MHKDTPTILRILMKSSVDPLSESEESVGKMVALRKRIVELVSENDPLPDLDVIELHVYKLLQEDGILKRSYRLDLKASEEWIEIDQRGEPVLKAE